MRLCQDRYQVPAMYFRHEKCALVIVFEWIKEIVLFTGTAITWLKLSRTRIAVLQLTGTSQHFNEGLL